MTKKHLAWLGTLPWIWLSVASASGPCVPYSEEWLKCENDTDCTVEETACYGRGAYNNQFLSLVRQHNKCIRPMIKCAPPPEGDADKNTAVCHDKKCVAIVGKGSTRDSGDRETVVKLEKRIQELEREKAASFHSRGEVSYPKQGETIVLNREELKGHECPARGTLLSEARMVPYFRNGKSIGMRLFAIRAGSVFSRMGLKNGDIIVSANDTPTVDPMSFASLMCAVDQSGLLTLRLERNGSGMSLSYKIPPSPK